jgi:Animal haem peroxidase
LSNTKITYPSRHGLVGRHVKAEEAVPIAAKAAKAAVGEIATTPATDALSVPVTPGGKKGQGFFDRMFSDLPPLTAQDTDLEALANAMKDPDPTDPSLDNPNVPAGFTYLGQFIDHDISLDLSPLSAKIEDPTMVQNFRTPGLDLDCLYGSGLGPHRFLFRQDEPKFLIGTASQSPDAGGVDIPPLPNDLERTRHGVAMIGDHRNDENLVVAQTHLALLKFHNKVVDHLAAQGHAPSTLFDEASKLVRWHYQWMVLHDFVERITETGIVAKLLSEGRKFYRFKTVPFMPVEFAGAAYRLGHSMVREEYSHNRVFRPVPPRLAPASLALLFRFSSLSGQINGELPGGVPVLPSNWVIDWRRWYEFNTPAGTPNFEFNRSRKLDPMLTPTLHTLPGFPPGRDANLAFRNLRRGVILGLPSGQDVAAAMKQQIPSLNPLTPAEIATGPDGAVAQQKGFDTATPLWYYILKEAQVRGNGQRLGPVGARLVAEVFVGLVQGDKDSFLSQSGWTPTLPSKTPGTFFMTDLLQFVGDISPIDGITTVSTL